MQPDLSKIIKLAEEVASPLGLSVVEARMSQQGKQRSLEVTIYRQQGRINLADCETVSRQLDELLERQSPPVIEGSFLLEVQSPGIDRKLKSQREFQIFVGQPVEVKTKEKMGDLGCDITGVLCAAAADKLTITHPEPLRDEQSKGNKKGKKSAYKAASLTLPEQIEIDCAKLISVRLSPMKLETEEAEVAL